MTKNSHLTWFECIQDTEWHTLVFHTGTYAVFQLGTFTEQQRVVPFLVI